MKPFSDLLVVGQSFNTACDGQTTSIGKQVLSTLQDFFFGPATQNDFVCQMSLGGAEKMAHLLCHWAITDLACPDTTISSQWPSRPRGNKASKKAQNIWQMRLRPTECDCPEEIDVIN